MCSLNSANCTVPYIYCTEKFIVAKLITLQISGKAFTNCVTLVNTFKNEIKTSLSWFSSTPHGGRRSK
jgi:hypothetical protein